MKPSEYYQKKVSAGSVQWDAAQQPALHILDEIYAALEVSKNSPWYLKYFPQKKVRGLYLWGAVGIGKTFLMDCFYETLSSSKLRMHFHQFMRRIHAELKIIQGEKNPLEFIAKKIANETRVICFDEFFVSDIADAMLLGELFCHLFENKVTLIASSNTPPDLLYKEGLQRERFLPAIALIKTNTTVLHLHSKNDYRLQHIQKAGVYYTPLGETAEQHMDNAFVYFSHGTAPEFDDIILCDRTVKIVKRAGSVIWFDFEIICGRPRSQQDYLEIAKSYRTVFLQNVRSIASHENDLILSFIFLIDILYDAHCRVVISSAVAPNAIYRDGKYQGAFQRTLSRLIEMQSSDYVHFGISGNLLTNL